MSLNTKTGGIKQADDARQKLHFCTPNCEEWSKWWGRKSLKLNAGLNGETAYFAVKILPLVVRSTC
jgi:hypothetical protein